MQTETDQQFMRRMATTFGFPSAADAARFHRIETRQVVNRIIRKLRSDNA